MRFTRTGSILAIALMLGVSAPAMAQQGNTVCENRGGAPCTNPLTGERSRPHDRQDTRKEARHHREPRAGDSARRAPMLQQAKASRLPKPPKGQHYRIMDDRVVRVDDRSKKVVAVLGPVDRLITRH